MEYLNISNNLELKKIWPFLMVMVFFLHNCRSQFLEVFSGDEDDSSEEDYDIGDLDPENIAEDAILSLVRVLPKKRFKF